MARFTEEDAAFLRDTFGSRVTFDRLERKMYGRDIAAMPSLVRPLVGRTLPDAVVQPRTEEELSALVRWAEGRGVPLTPRGRSTSGYGGAVPKKRGVVVDFHRFQRIVSVDEEAAEVTAEAGVIWENLDRRLARHGLTLRLYPTSYPSATVGGWLAQGGAGIGSYAYGWFPENVVSARVVLSGGEVREMSGADLDLVADAEGITGLIAQVTLRVRRRRPEKPLALAFDTAERLQAFSEGLSASDLPVWSMIFINPKMAEMKNRAPVRMRHGRPAEERVPLPEGCYVATLTFAEEDEPALRQGLAPLLERTGGRELSEALARHEWESRFELMIVKRLGPSLVPAEVVVPLSSLGAMLDDVSASIAHPVVKEGVVIRRNRGGRPEAVILGFIPADERSFGYDFVFSLSLTLLKIAERHGGRAYATGMYFARMADAVLGAERTARLRAFKKEADPRDVLNPGKVLSGGLLGAVMGLARLFEPLSRPMGNKISTAVGERAEEPVRGIPADVAWYAYSCSSCGYCVDTCDQFFGRGWESQSPRGKWYWLREYMEGREEWTQAVVDTFLVCTTCEVCDLRCSAALPIEPSWMKLRGQLVHEEKRMTFPPFEMMGAALASQGNIWAAYRKNRSDWFPEDLRERHGTGVRAPNVYFAGCTASYVEHDIAQASVRLLDAAGVPFTHLGPKESCCATPMLVAGKWDLFEKVMRQNIRNVRSTGADTVICSCPACDMMWRHVYPAWARKLGIEFGIRTRHYSEVVSEALAEGALAFPGGAAAPGRVTFHDSCHMGRVSGLYEEPRALVKAVPGAELVEMEHNRDESHCCGSVLTLIKEPEVAADIGKVRLDEAVGAGARTLVAVCPCCEFQLRVAAEKRGVDVEVVDLARFAASALGHDFPDPNPEVQAQWAVFEAMIALMTPEGFAALMGTMWKEVIDAMPLGMGGMMRFLGKVPGGLALARPLFPVLFPLLLPGMMPRLLPAIIARVRERVPMPDTMAEQMPSLMPGVMDRLMPHMVADLVPLVTGPLIAHLRGCPPPAGDGAAG